MLYYNIMNTLDTDINLNQQFLGAKDTHTPTLPAREAADIRMKTAEKMIRDTKCVGCIAECYGLVGRWFDCAALRRHASSSRRRRRCRVE